MNIYCLKCKTKTETTNVKQMTTKNNRLTIQGNCKTCKTKKSTFLDQAAKNRKKKK